MLKSAGQLIDQSIATAAVDVTTENTFDLINAELTLQEIGGLLTADGNEQTLYVNDAPLGNYEPRVMFVDLDNMLGGDTTDIRVYYRITDGGGLQLHDFAQYIGADGGLTNGKKLITIDLYPNRFGCQITLRQTAGTLRTYHWEIFTEN